MDKDDAPSANGVAVRTLWQSDEPGMRAGLCPQHLAPAWAMLLLGDGSPTRHLGLLSGEPVGVEVVSMSDVGAGIGPDAPADTARIAPPLLRREVWLTVPSGARLAHAVSWWGARDVEAHLKDRAQPIWSSLSDRRTELYREVRAIALVDSPALEAAFTHAGPLWCRHYLFWHDGRPLTLIRETFSPFVERWLGPSRSAATLPSACDACRARGGRT